MTDRQARYVELAELAVRASDGDLDAAGHARLEALLSSDPQAQADYIELMQTVSALDWRAGDAAHTARAADNAISQVLMAGVIDRQRAAATQQDLLDEQHRLEREREDRENQRWQPQLTDGRPADRVIVIPKSLVYLGLAAAVALVASVVYLSRPVAPAAGPTPPPIAEQTESPRTLAQGPVQVATVVEVLDAVDSDGRTIRVGDPVFDAPLDLASGFVQLDLTSGVSLTVEGPARLVPGSDMMVSLERGTLVGLVPERAHGFVIRTATMDVVDLGTEFAVEVASTGQGGLVQVLDGSVRLEPGRYAQAFEPVVAEIGDALMVRDAGTPEAIELESNEYYRHVPSAYELLVREDRPLLYWRFEGLDEQGRHAGLGSSGSLLTGLTDRDLSGNRFPAGERDDRGLWLTRSHRPITCDTPAGLDTQSGFTVEAWVWVPSDCDRRMRVISNNALRADGGHDGGFGLAVSGLVGDRLDDGPVLMFTGFEVFDAYSQAAVPTERWVHVAATFDGLQGVLRLMIDGESVPFKFNNNAGNTQYPGFSGNLAIASSREPIRIGNALPFHASEYWVGGLDEVAVYPRVLHPDDLAAHAQRGHRAD